MIHLKVKTKDIRFTIPIPYTFLSVAISISSSKHLQKMINKWTHPHFERKNMEFTFPRIDKKMLMPIVKELKHNKGIVLVDIKAKDGTEVKVRL